jgi:hypothetical protein
MPLGPNSGFGHQSALFVIERHVNYIVGCIRHAARNRLRSMEVRRDVQNAYNDGVQQRFQGTVWTGNCRSWYKNQTGRIVTNTPDSGFAYWRRLMRPDFAHFVVEPAHVEPNSVAPLANA